MPSSCWVSVMLIDGRMFTHVPPEMLPELVLFRDWHIDFAFFLNRGMLLSHDQGYCLMYLIYKIIHLHFLHTGSNSTLMWYVHVVEPCFCQEVQELMGQNHRNSHRSSSAFTRVVEILHRNLHHIQVLCCNMGHYTLKGLLRIDHQLRKNIDLCTCSFLRSYNNGKVRGLRTIDYQPKTPTGGWGSWKGLSRNFQGRHHANLSQLFSELMLSNDSSTPESEQKMKSFSCQCG